MASKKLLFLTGMFCLLASYGYSQRVGASYDVKDSSVVPDKRMPQHTEFLNGTYNFPAKPRNMWEIGIKAGLTNVSGDIPSRFFTPISLGAHVRKAFGYIFSVRLEYMYGKASGRTFNQAANFYKNTAWTSSLGSLGYFAPTRQILATGDLLYSNGTITGPTFEPVYYNYRTTIHDLSLQGVVTLNNIRFHKSKTGFNFYGFAGIGGTIYDTRINALDGGSAKYDFASITPNGVYKSRKDTYDALKNLMDDSYETPAENQGPRRPKLFGDTFKPSGTIGVGLAFKLGSRLNLAIEDRQTFIKDDLLDGQRWQEHDKPVGGIK